MTTRDSSAGGHDSRLASDVRVLGGLVGEVIADQLGPELFETVEGIRVASIQRRSQDHPEGNLRAHLAGVASERADGVIRAFSTYFQLINLAETVHRIRRRRDHLREDSSQVGSLQDSVTHLAEANIDFATITEYLGDAIFEPVFTAHPTEATRRTILEKEQAIVRLLIKRLDPERSPDDERRLLAQIRTAVTAAWQTRWYPDARPGVADEMEHVLFYLTDVLYRVVPDFYDNLRAALVNHYGDQADDLRMPVVLRFGSWVGGDMDGNPNVGAETIRTTLAAHRQLIVERYLSDVESLARQLSQSRGKVEVSSAIMHRLEKYSSMFESRANQFNDRHRDMPYRCLLELIAERLRATLEGTPRLGYLNGAEFANDIQLIRASLEEHDGRYAGREPVRRLQQRARTFGFHLATLDVRQDSEVFRAALADMLERQDWRDLEPQARSAVLEEILAGPTPLVEMAGRAELSESTVETLDVFRQIRKGRKRYGSNAFGPLIISMAQGADDVMTVLALARAGELVEAGEVDLDVAPLLETVDDLIRGPEILQSLLTSPVYTRHLANRGNHQMIMVGYSDSNKDSGIAAARWAIHSAQVRLVSVAREHGIAVSFFHGRGGTVSRGGGNSRQAILAAPDGSVQGRMRITEQGEVINQKYGIRELALRNLEQSVGALMTVDLMRDESRRASDESRAVMAQIARHSRQAYRGLVYEDERFVPYFRQATPIDVIERLGLGSRPPSRRSGEGVENLRAIPWVFSWGQTRTGLPGIFGIGSGLERAVADGHEERMKEMVASWPFFANLLNDVEMVLAKSDAEISAAYSELADPQLREVHDVIRAEFERAAHWILTLKGTDRLLADQPVLRRSIDLRNPYVDPMNFLQIELLQRWRASKRREGALLDSLFASVNGIARGLQNTG